MLAGFSWVRIDKGTIHCNFRYLDIDQVRTVVDYLLSYYEYHNLTVGIVDLGGSSVLPDVDDHATGDHYRPSYGNPNMSYYYLVQLHRHGTIIPQGSVEIMKKGINALVERAIVPQSVFISRMSDNILDNGEQVTLEALCASPDSSYSPVWATTDASVLSIVPDSENPYKCVVTAASPGSADISVSIEVPDAAPMEISTIYPASLSWTDNIYKYIGSDITIPTDEVYKYGLDHFTQDHYYQCVYDATSSVRYKWEETTYDPAQPVTHTYKDIYSLVVKTYVRITKPVPSLCLYHTDKTVATTPSSSATIYWKASNLNVEFDYGVAVGSEVHLSAKRVGTSVIEASITDSTGTYSDSYTVSIFAFRVTPSAIKVVEGGDKLLTITKQNIFSTDPAIPITWASSNVDIAAVSELPRPSEDPVIFAQAKVTGRSSSGSAQSGTTMISILVEDPTDGQVYTDTVKVTVGKVAIDLPETTEINLLNPDHTITLKCSLAAGYSISSSGWVSENTSVVQVGTPTTGDKPNDTVVITGKEVGTSYITVVATDETGTLSETDKILIRVVNVETVTEGEMLTFTHGQFNSHGTIDWDHPTGEEGTLVVDDPPVDLATETEVDEFVDNLFDANDSTESDD